MWYPDPAAAMVRLRRAIRRDPRLSVRLLSRRTGIPRATVHRLRRELALFNYKLLLRHRLRPGNRAKRLRFCRWLPGKWKSPTFRRFLLEAHFLCKWLC